MFLQSVHFLDYDIGAPQDWESLEHSSNEKHKEIMDYSKEDFLSGEVSILSKTFYSCDSGFISLSKHHFSSKIYVHDKTI